MVNKSYKESRKWRVNRVMIICFRWKMLIQIRMRVVVHLEKVTFKEMLILLLIWNYLNKDLQIIIVITNRELVEVVLLGLDKVI
jgi:hypothetical protein